MSSEQTPVTTEVAAAPRAEFQRKDGARPRRERAPREEAKWVPATKLGRLVDSGKITDISEIFYHALPIKEVQIVDKLLKIQEDVVKVMSVQKQTKAGQRTSQKAFIIVGDGNGHVGLGVRTSRDPPTAIRSAIVAAKLSIVPVRRGYWGGNIGAPHTINSAVSGKCGSVSIRLIPAPRGAGLVCAPALTKILQFAGIQDVFTSACGHTRTTGNFVAATYQALRKSYAILTPDLWAKTETKENIFSEHAELLQKK